MKIAEVVKLSFGGYSNADIKELSGMSAEAQQLALNGKKLDEVKELIALATADEGTQPEAAVPEQGKGDPEPDYKAMYEELKGENETLSATIKEIQQTNIRQNQQGNVKSDDEALVDIVKEFL